MTLCSLQRIESGWWCPTCDPEQNRLLPVEASRECRKGLPPYRGQGPSIAEAERSNTSRDQLETELHALHANGESKRTWPDILAALNKCFGGCRYLEGNCTFWLNSSRANCTARRKAWIEHLLAHDCNANDEPARMPLVTPRTFSRTRGQPK